jgi:3',5'-cyclic AMP phosphodiesterase CpdA
MTDFSFIQITDHHLMESDGQTRLGFTPDRSLRAVFRHIAAGAGQQADFILSSGDLVEPPTDATYSYALQLLGTKPAAAPGPLRINIEGLHDFPMYVLPGNHDERAFFFRHLFPESAGADLFNYTFEHKGVRFICTDWGEAPKAVFFPQTRAFLAEAVRSDQPLVILTHHHVTPVGSRWLDDFIADEIGQFWEIVSAPGVKERVLGILSGHVHIPYETSDHGIPVLGLRSTAFPFAKTDEFALTDEPPQYRVVQIQGNKLTSHVYEVPI